ncbi:purine-cytosine permease family protein [Saccharothrix variisporea]|uniref:Purine-cytosine permease-like protein n=1 Tax=Saccharothrix variisporea TaxID=543527 RepID=A0A495X1Z7_9PSEU|nr:cytosine permease [Saccharothrix variisporea]RKT67980.1 purine-cytosine permease-like protein [Saccharothrix variisporea]
MSASQTGHELVDPAERTTRPHEFLWIWHSAQFSFGVVVLGSVPVSFGLGWWGSVTSALVGLLIGTLVFAPLARFGMRTGATDAVSSAAHFGVRGRLVTTLITLCVAIGFFAIAVWTGATAVVAALQRLVGWGDLVVVVPPVALAVVLVAIFGYRALLTTYKTVTVIGGLVLAGLVVALSPGFDAGISGEPILGDFWRTWLLGVSFGVTVPITYATLQGDYSRHLRPGTTDRQAVWWNGVGMFLSNAIALLIGIMASTMITDHSVPWVIGLTDTVPSWFTAFVIVFGFFGTLPQGALCVYAAGVTANSLFRRASRVTCTAVVAVIGVLVLYLGAVVYDAIDSISTFILFLLLLIAPWSAIMLVGFARSGGRYVPEELLGRGRYWFAGGFDPRAFAAFLPAVALGFAFANNSVYVGPLADLAGGVDLSCVVPFAFAGGVYWLLWKAAPERLGGTPPAERFPEAELSIGNRRGS